MPTAAELSGAKTPLGAAIAEGVETLSLNQTIRFTKYIRLVLPYDGYLFWVRADLVSSAALYNVMKYNQAQYGQPEDLTSKPITFLAKGSLHYATTMTQMEDESFGLNTVVFTSLGPINDLNEVASSTMYIGDFQGIRFAFSQRGPFYQQADTYHYRGEAIYPSMETQIIDDLRTFNTKDLVVSNSLPVWLGLDQLMPMYPSYLVPDNIVPPYGSVHISPDDTSAIQAIPLLGAKGSHNQLVRDRVRITLYGMRNFNALDYQDMILQYIERNDDVMGLMNTPIVRDEKRQQNELSVIAMKKTIIFEVSYYQLRVRDVARQLILSCIPDFTIDNL